jgi:alkanesulfonate monooxygenase SsuD/methylene tetrahydromethanopterin reductase-like flavin-dependent oxidoreductase (luciferase family)
LEIAREAERRGFAGIYMPSRYGNMAQCTALAFATERIAFGTAIAPIYSQTTEEFAANAAYIHEVSRGRFRFGIGVAHGPMHRRLGISPGKPLADTRAFVEKLHSYDEIGALPPIVLAALRRPWWRSPARSPRVCCSPMRACRISRTRSPPFPRQSAPTPIL